MAATWQPSNISVSETAGSTRPLKDSCPQAILIKLVSDCLVRDIHSLVWAVLILFLLTQRSRYQSCWQLKELLWPCSALLEYWNLLYAVETVLRDTANPHSALLCNIYSLMDALGVTWVQHLTNVTMLATCRLEQPGFKAPTTTIFANHSQLSFTSLG